MRCYSEASQADIKKAAEYVASSEYRQKTLRSLWAEPKQGSDISREHGIAIQNVSKTFRELEGEGLVRCLTPGKWKNRIYDLTKKGFDVVKRLPPKGYDREDLEGHLGGALDESRIAYSRNLPIQGRMFEEEPSFIILEEAKPAHVVECRVLPPDPLLLHRLHTLAFLARDLKEGPSGVKDVFLLTGKAESAERVRESIVSPDHLDGAFPRDEVGDLVDRLDALGMRQE